MLTKVQALSFSFKPSVNLVHKSHPKDNPISKHDHRVIFNLKYDLIKFPVLRDDECIF